MKYPVKPKNCAVVYNRALRAIKKNCIIFVRTILYKMRMRSKSSIWLCCVVKRVCFSYSVSCRAMSLLKYFKCNFSVNKGTFVLITNDDAAANANVCVGD